MPRRARVTTRGARTLTAAVAALLLLGAACEERRPRPSSGGDARREDDAAPYQAEVEEGPGAAVAILVDTSGSMKERAPGDSRPKYDVALEAIEAMLAATDAFVAKRPDFPIKIGIYSFSSSVTRLRPIQPYDRAAIRQSLARLPRPGGGTAIGEALREARPICTAPAFFGSISWSSPTATTPTAAIPRMSRARSFERVRDRCRCTSSRSTQPPRSSGF